MSKSDEVVIAYKGFNADWTCRDYQFEVGKTYKHDGKAVLCNSGFHACEYPLDVFGYYPPTGQLAQVELRGVAPAEKDGDSKRAAREITIKAALTIPLFVQAAIEWTVKRCDPVKAQHSKGYRSASSATGYQSASSATGYQSASSATGDQSASSATGDQSASSATGYRSASSAKGNNAVAAAFGLHSKAMADETGMIVVAWWDENVNRKRLTVGYVGEDVEANVWYRADNAGKLVKVNQC